MTPEGFKQLLAQLITVGHELSGIECKGPGSRQNKEFLAKVIRAMLGMANRRDGGLVIIGVEENKDGMSLVGLGDPEAASWKYDDLSDSVAVYADPSISFEAQEYEDEHARKYVLISVQEFESIPILCKKDFPPTLRRGGCYVRSRRKPETVEIPTQEDMRDLLDLATEKGLRKFYRQSAAAGIKVPVPIQLSDQELFENQVSNSI
jgi:predicted HTH transcriptional regulator